MTRFLTPLEKFDLDRLNGRAAFVVMKTLRWLLFALIGLRLFVFLEGVWWYRIGWHSIVLGGWISFLLIPWALYQLVSRRISDGTFHVEKTLPMTELRHMMGKFKVLLIYVLQFSGPLFLIGFLSDPNLAFTFNFLRTAYFIRIDSVLIGWELLALTLFLFVGLWSMVVSILFAMALGKAQVVPMLGLLVIGLLVIFFGLSLVEMSYYQLWMLNTSVNDPGYRAAMVILSVVAPSISFLVLRARIAR